MCENGLCEIPQTDGIRLTRDDGGFIHDIGPGNLVI